jgi:hypothetical protein
MHTTQVYTYTCAHIHSCTHTLVHTYIRTCNHTCIQTSQKHLWRQVNPPKMTRLYRPCDIQVEVGIPSSRICITLIFSPYARVRMRALKGMACCARVTPASLHASPCSGEALTSPACRACGCGSPFRACFWSMPYGENTPSMTVPPGT